MNRGRGKVGGVGRDVEEEEEAGQQRLRKEERGKVANQVNCVPTDCYDQAICSGSRLVFYTKRQGRSSQVERAGECEEDRTGKKDRTGRRRFGQSKTRRTKKKRSKKL
jgi:hypothetical protein